MYQVSLDINDFCSSFRKDVFWQSRGMRWKLNLSASSRDKQFSWNTFWIWFSCTSKQMRLSVIESWWQKSENLYRLHYLQTNVIYGQIHGLHFDVFYGKTRCVYKVQHVLTVACTELKFASESSSERISLFWSRTGVLHSAINGKDRREGNN